MNGTRSGWTPRAGSHNFGQRSFSGTATASTLCTANMSTPTIADPKDYFDIDTYTGNGSASRSFSGFQFSPDLLWVKSRSTTTSHVVVDRHRGSGRELHADIGDVEFNNSSGHLSFQTDGYTLGSDSQWNGSGASYVAWVWNCGSGSSTNTDGSITSSIRTEPTAGFSIVKYTGTGSGSSVGHGLGAEPHFIMFKNRDRGNAWSVYTKAMGGTKRLRLTLDGGFQTSPAFFNNTDADATRFYVGSHNGTNRNEEDHVALLDSYRWVQFNGHIFGQRQR